MSQRQVKRVRRMVRVQRKEAREIEIAAARVGVRRGWRWTLVRPCIPWLYLVLPERWVVEIANWAAKHFRWRIDQGDWRPYDPPRHFTSGDLR